MVKIPSLLNTKGHIATILASSVGASLPAMLTRLHSTFGQLQKTPIPILL